MKNTNIKKKIIAAVLSAITIVSIGVVAMTSVSAAPRRAANEIRRGNATNNVRVVEDTTPKADDKVGFFWP